MFIRYHRLVLYNFDFPRPAIFSISTSKACLRLTCPSLSGSLSFWLLTVKVRSPSHSWDSSTTPVTWTSRDDTKDYSKHLQKADVKQIFKKIVPSSSPRQEHYSPPSPSTPAASSSEPTCSPLRVRMVSQPQTSPPPVWSCAGVGERTALLEASEVYAKLCREYRGHWGRVLQTLPLPPGEWWELAPSRAPQFWWRRSPQHATAWSQLPYSGDIGRTSSVN